MHTELVGAARPRLAFLHGLFGRGRNWTQIAQALAAEGYPAVLFDLPNHGRSPWTAQFSYPDLAEAVAAEIELKLGSAAQLLLVGHSMGGKVAMLTALRHPELVSGLVVVDIAPANSDQVPAFADLIAAMRSLDLAALTSRTEAEQLLAGPIPHAGVRKFLLQNLRRNDGWHWEFNLQLLGDSLPLIGAWPDVGAASYSGPVLWLTGERSPYVAEHHVPEMIRLFPAVRQVVVPGAGHWLHSDAPDIVIRELLQFAAQVADFTGR